MVRRAIGEFGDMWAFVRWESAVWNKECGQKRRREGSGELVWTAFGSCYVTGVVRIGFVDGALCSPCLVKTIDNHLEIPIFSFSNLEEVVVRGLHGTSDHVNGCHHSWVAGH